MKARFCDNCATRVHNEYSFELTVLGNDATPLMAQRQKAPWDLCNSCFSLLALRDWEGLVTRRTACVGSQSVDA